MGRVRNVGEAVAAGAKIVVCEKVDRDLDKPF
jgi:hypothetical protein